MVKVSVIVPVYGVEKYIVKCIDSIVNQKLKDIEIIVVNDGTKDNSQEIIDRYVKKYPKLIKSYIKENGGLSSARNFGIKYATGEYIAFIDSDDWVSLDMFEKMYNKAKENNFDIVTCDVNYIYPNETICVSSNINQDFTTLDKVKESMIDIYPIVCNKLFKKELFEKNIYFKEKVWFEDVEFLYRLYPYIKSIGTIKEPLYQYLQREGTISNTFDKRLYDFIYNWNGIIEFYKKNNFYDAYKNELEYSYVRYLYATFIKRATNYQDKKEYNIAVSTAIKNVKEHFQKYRKNKYFYSSKKGLYLLVFNKVVANIYYKMKGIRK